VRAYSGIRKVLSYIYTHTYRVDAWLFNINQTARKVMDTRKNTPLVYFLTFWTDILTVYYSDLHPIAIFQPFKGLVKSAAVLSLRKRHSICTECLYDQNTLYNTLYSTL
jgi:hypothetical protein